MQYFKLTGLSGDRLEAALFQQASIAADERALEQSFSYSDEHIGLSVVPTRQDLVLLIGNARLINTRVRHIRLMVFVMMLCGIAVAGRLWQSEIIAGLAKLGIFIS